MLVSLDLSNGNWNISEYEPRIGPQYVYFGFSDGDSDTVFFTDLNFGLKLMENGETVFEENYPHPDVKYLSTDQKVLESLAIILDYEKDYSIYFWASNLGKLYEHNLYIGTIEIPPPYVADELDTDLNNSTFVKLTEDPETDNFEGRVYHNTTDKTLRIYHNGQWEDLVISSSSNS